jgi:hypothetical protein
MIDYADWITKLKADIPSLYPKIGTIGFARDIAKLKTGTTKKLPAIFVLPFQESVLEVDSTATNAELVTQKVEVVTIATDYAGADGSELTLIRNAINKVLMGWQIPNADDSVHMEGGARTGYQDKYISWTDVYSVDILNQI